MARPLIALTALIAGVALLAGCGGGGTDMTQGMSAEQVLTESAKRTEALTSYRFGVDVKADVDIDAEGAVGTLLANPLDINGEGGAKDPGDFTLDLTANLGPGPIQANVTKVDDSLYLTVLGQAIKLDVDAQTVRSLDATQLAPAIAGWITNPQIVGTEDINGVQVVHIRGDVDETALAEDIGGLAGGLGAEGAVTPGAGGPDGDLETGVVDVWVGQEDLLIHKAAADVVSKDPLAAAEAVKSIDLQISASISDFNAPVEITAPSGAREVSLDSIAGLLGG
ncbi:MAG: LppX_LprAFG lipoprotein [Actinomycetota bacterium]